MREEQTVHSGDRRMNSFELVHQDLGFVEEMQTTETIDLPGEKEGK